MNLYLMFMKMYLCFSLVFLMLSFKSSDSIVMWEIYDSLVFSIVIEQSAMILLSIVFLISGSVMGFSEYYMNMEKFKLRFLTLVTLFILSMSMLILIPDLFCVLLGWDGLGLVSYLLVIYYNNSKSLGAGNLTVLTNRLGDGFLLMGVGMIMFEDSLMMYSLKGSMMLGLLIILAAFTKSAQFPFCSWLPAAMAAPTPVSALVHSSTLVTAGVFILYRMHMFLKGLDYYFLIMMISGSVTMILSGMGAVVESDMKKIIALSTLSQLGMMISSLGLDIPNFTYFHLMTHAMFKALLFIGAGFIIYLNSHWQDLRKVSVVSFFPMNFMSVVFLTSNFSLMGMPFLAGFYSKDKILEMSQESMNLAMIFSISGATILTSWYSMRFLGGMMLVNDKYFSGSSNLELSDLCFKSTLILSFASIIGGNLLNYKYLGDLDVVSVKFLPLLFVISGMLSFFFFGMKKFMIFTSSMWFLSNLSTQYMLKTEMLMMSYLSIVDHGWYEYLGGQGLNQAMVKIGYFFVNSIHLYFMSHIILGIIIVMMLYWGGSNMR